MVCVTDLPELKESEKTAVTLGKFDGLHRGHMELINCILKKQNEGQKGIVFTFIMPSDFFFGKRTKGHIITKEQRREILANLGIDILIEYPFDKKFADISASDFIKKYLVKRLNVATICCGTDYRFGHNREGSVLLLSKYKEKYNYELYVKDKVVCDGERVSSSLIKKLLLDGNVEKAEHYLGRKYSFGGIAEEITKKKNTYEVRLKCCPEKAPVKPGLYKVFLSDNGAESLDLNYVPDKESLILLRIIDEYNMQAVFGEKTYETKKLQKGEFTNLYFNKKIDE